MYTVIDIETTGNGIKGNRVTEIAIFTTDGTSISDKYCTLINPQCPIPTFITGLTGITDEMVQNAPTFSEVADQILERTKDAIFVAHSVNFDYGVLKEEFRLLGIDFTRKKLCTVRLSRKLLPGFASYSLGKLCSQVGIPLEDRHRARGDAHATVLLFHKLLHQKEAPAVLKTFLNSRNQEATLPPLLAKSVVDQLPKKPGIYFFKDAGGKIIYVGKAIDIKKRVLGHFYDKSTKESVMCREIAAIDFKLSGSELIALLMESDAIKKHYPKYNVAQKRNPRRYGIFSYEDRKGILHLSFNTLKTVPKPLLVFSNITDCRLFLQQMSETFLLCPKYLQLLPSGDSCSKVVNSPCEGICRDKETAVKYNEKVTNAIQKVIEQRENQLLRLSGREPNENGVVLIKEGQYVGYGFIEKETPIHNFNDIEAFIIPQKNTLETQRIVEGALSKTDCFSFTN